MKTVQTYLAEEVSNFLRHFVKKEYRDNKRDNWSNSTFTTLCANILQVVNCSLSVLTLSGKSINKKEKSGVGALSSSLKWETVHKFVVFESYHKEVPSLSKHVLLVCSRPLKESENLLNSFCTIYVGKTSPESFSNSAT